MKFTERETEVILKDIREALRAVEKKHNIGIQRGSARYGEDIGFRMTVSKVGDVTTHSGVDVSKVITPEAREFQKRAKSFKLRPDLLFYEFHVSGQGHIIIQGYSTRARKYPIKYTKDGQNFKCSVEYMVKMIEKSIPEYMI